MASTYPLRITYAFTPSTGHLKGLRLESSFGATHDAVAIHVRGLRANPQVDSDSIRVEEVPQS